MFGVYYDEPIVLAHILGPTWTFHRGPLLGALWLLVFITKPKGKLHWKLPCNSPLSCLPVNALPAARRGPMNGAQVAHPENMSAFRKVGLGCSASSLRDLPSYDMDFVQSSTKPSTFDVRTEGSRAGCIPESLFLYIYI